MISKKLQNYNLNKLHTEKYRHFNKIKIFRNTLNKFIAIIKYNYKKI